MDTPFFSIIIPTFNSGSTLGKCLISIYEQSFDNFEVIIVDGKSTDNTLSIISSFNNNKTNVISETDLGIYDAMNKGIKLAKGTWIYFLGSDDSLYNDTILTHIKSITETNASPRFIYGNVLTSGNYIKSYEQYTYSKLVKINICHQAIFYHFSLFKENYNLKYKVLADWDFNLKVFRGKNFPLYTNQIIARYSLNGVSSNWTNHREYLSYFKKRIMILRYRNFLYYLMLEIDRLISKFKL